MFQLLFIRVVNFFFNLVQINFFLFIFIPVVIFNHHNSFSFIVPRCIGVLIDDAVFATNEEGFRKDTIDHHDETFDCEETWVVVFWKVKEIVIFFYLFLEFLFHFVYVFLFFVETFILDFFLEL